MDLRSPTRCLSGLGVSVQGKKAGERGLAQVDKEGKATSQIWEDHEASNDFMKSIMWRSTDFLRHVVGEVEERGMSTTTCL